MSSTTIRVLSCRSAARALGAYFVSRVPLARHIIGAAAAFALTSLVASQSDAGTIARTYTDGTSFVEQWDLNGAPLPGFSMPGNAALSSLDYDPVTGDLYLQASNGMYRRTPSGVLTQLNAAPTNLNSGGDIAVFSEAVPEPSTVALAAVGLVGMFWGRGHGKRR